MKFKEYKKLLAAVTVSAMIASLPGAAAFGVNFLWLTPAALNMSFTVSRNA